MRFMKLDTQGSELAILKGTERTLEGCCGVDLTPWFLPFFLTILWGCEPLPKTPPA